MSNKIKSKFFCAAGVLIFGMIILCMGCSGKKINFDDQPAVKLQEEGYYTVRYEECKEALSEDEAIKCRVSVNVLKSLNDEQKQEIIDYYELVYTAKYDANGNYVEKKNNEFLCYIIFWDKDSDTELDKIKYSNKNDTKITEDDKSEFLPPYFKEEVRN